MELFGHYFQLTLNLLTTPFFLTVMAGVVLWGVKRIISALISAKEKRDEERHNQVVKRLDENLEDHKEFRAKLYSHEHRISTLEMVNKIRDATIKDIMEG